MDTIALPEHLIARFRASGFERLERIEAGWAALAHGGAEGSVEEEMLRDLHTLKGDARVMGFAEAGVLCQRLEDLLAVARERRYRVHEDVDIVVNMGLQFIGMLLRKKVGAPRGGIDLDGFLKQIEEVLAELLRRSSEAPGQALSGPVHLHFADTHDRISAGARNRLSVVATAMFLEHLRATSGASRSRLRDLWLLLAQEIALFDSAPLAPIVERHARAALDLAKQLGKEIAVVRDAGEVAVGTEALDAINTAVLHTLRNSVDHGVEPPEERRARGKPSLSTISVRAMVSETGVEVVVQDDGAGVDFERVRERAVEKGLLGAGGARATDDQLLDVLFLPGFSTREKITDVSGRGVGLDAVRAAVARVGGSATLASKPGMGTTLTIRVPVTRRTMDVLVFRGARTSVLFAVPASWSVAVAPTEAIASVDMADVLAPSTGGPADPRVVELRRDRMSISFAAGSNPEPAKARRVCPTALEDQIEIVDLGRAEAILVRPEVILAARKARRGGV